MSSKKRKLELFQANEEAKEDEAVYAKGARRLEIQSADGKENPNFSAENSVIKLDHESLKEYHQSVGREQLVKRAKTKLKIERARQELEQVQLQDDRKREIDEDLKLKWKKSKVAMRLLYGAVLIYFGITGILRLISYAFAPASTAARPSFLRNFIPGSSRYRGIDWMSGIYSLLAVAALIALWRLRAFLLRARENPDHWVFKRFPSLENRAILNAVVFFCEGICFALGATVAVSMVTGFSLSSLSTMSLIFLLACLTAAYVAFRKLMADVWGSMDDHKH